MSRPVLLYYEILGFQPATIEYINRHFELIILPDPNHDTEDILIKPDVIFAPMGFKLDSFKIDRCLNLKVIGTPTTGTAHIDTEYAFAKGIAISSLKDQQEFLRTITATAELTWGLILAVTRKIPKAFDSVLEGKWTGREFGKLTPKMLSNMRLGVIGLGRLGSLLAQYGKAFGMEVSYYDPYIEDERYNKIRSLPELAGSNDIITVHVHLTKETENLIDSEIIRLMPTGSYIINTARGGIINEQALLESLRSGHLGGAGLDMLAGEHLPGFKDKLSEHPLVEYACKNDNLVITPKIGGCTVDAWQKTERHLADLLRLELEQIVN